jgi:hypothetical protein
MLLFGGLVLLELFLTGIDFPWLADCKFLPSNETGLNERRPAKELLPSVRYHRQVKREKGESERDCICSGMRCNYAIQLEAIPEQKRKEATAPNEKIHLARLHVQKNWSARLIRKRVKF